MGVLTDVEEDDENASEVELGEELAEGRDSVGVVGLQVA